jgi:anaerobic selenocysteine-containing dehydrogenase
MIIPRREFMKLLGVTAGAVGAGGCGRSWEVPDELVERALRGPGLESFAQTICGLCEGGCGLTVRLVDGLPVGLKGNPHHPLNRGGLCPVGQAGLEVLYAPERLQGPLRRGADGRYTAASWDEALGSIAGRLADLQKRGEGQRLALLSDEPGRLFHDLAGRFAGAFGSPNVAHSRDGAALPYTLTQGVADIPGFDLEGADLVLCFGLDLYEDGPTPLQAISAMVGSRPTETRCSLVHVGTRLSPSAAKAEQRVTVRPGTHAAFALGVAQVLVREGRYDRRFVAERTSGFEDWTDRSGRQRRGFRRLLLERYLPDRVAQLCGCEAASVVRVARRLAEASSPLAISGGEALQGSNATSTAITVHALNALLGAFDRPGGVVLPPPIPLTPLPPSPPYPADARRSIFAPGAGSTTLGLDPVGALADRVLEGSYPVEVLLVVSSNPVHDSPAGERLREAMERIPLVVALTPFRDETSAGADFILPSHVFLEGWRGSTTPQSIPFSTIGVAQPVVEPLFDTRHPADVLLEIGRRAGPPSSGLLPWGDYSEYLEQRLRGLIISGQGAVVTGSFEDTWTHFLEERGWRFPEQRAPQTLWEDLLREGAWWDPVRPRGDWARLMPTPSGRFEFFSSDLERRLREIGSAGEAGSLGGDEALRRGVETLALEAEGDEACLPHYEPPMEQGEGELVLVPFRPITARGRLGVTSPMLLEMFGHSLLSGWETWAELSPETAREMGLEDGDHVAVESERASMEAVVRVRPGGASGAVHVPLGLGHTEPYGAAGGIGSNPVALLAQVRDPLSGSACMAATRVRLRLLRRRPHGGPAPIHGGEVA